MVKKKFILQGLTTNTHTDAIQRIFSTPDIQQVIFSVAFVNEEGVLLLENEIRSASDKVKIFVGIRNDITSQQGLTRLFNSGATIYAIDTGARNIVFHPKIYLAKGLSEARLVIGSANLTLGGLNNNIEASIVMDLDLNDILERELVENIENEFLSLPSKDPEHITLITSQEQIELLRKNGLILDESEVSPPRPVVRGINPSNDAVSRISLSVLPRYRTIKRARPIHERTAELSLANRAMPETVTVPSKIGLELLWESKTLTERDLNIPSGTNTNPTGSINLDKGLLGPGIDHRSYFREEVFSHLQWAIGNTPTVEETEAKFELVVRGISYGEFSLRIAHTMGVESAAYRQHNAMSRLSWGTAKQYIAHTSLIGRTLSLYRKENPTKFLLEID